MEDLIAFPEADREANLSLIKMLILWIMIN
jgi:hypothetical protein